MKSRTSDTKTRSFSTNGDFSAHGPKPAQDDDVSEEVDKARRRAKERRKQRRRNVSLANLACIALTAAISVHMVGGINKRYSEYRVIQDQVVRQQAELKSSVRRYKAAELRLETLESDKGRTQMLVERGYVRPGERILIFPTSPRRQTDSMLDAPEPAEAVATPRGGASTRWNSLLRTLRGLAPEQPASPARSGEIANETTDADRDALSRASSSETRTHNASASGNQVGGD